MTWKEFKDAVESLGIQEDTRILEIQIRGWINPNKIRVKPHPDTVAVIISG